MFYLESFCHYVYSDSLTYNRENPLPSTELFIVIYQVSWAPCASGRGLLAWSLNHKIYLKTTK